MRRELSRVRRDFITSISNRTEQQNALLGGRKKGKSGEGLRGSGGSARSFSMPTASADGGSTQLSRLESSALSLDEARERVSWDGVFMSKVDSSANMILHRGEMSRRGNTRECRQAAQSTSQGTSRREASSGWLGSAILELAFQTGQ